MISIVLTTPGTGTGSGGSWDGWQGTAEDLGAGWEC